MEMIVPLDKHTRKVIIHAKWVNYTVYKNASVKLYFKMNTLIKINGRKNEHNEWEELDSKNHILYESIYLNLNWAKLI